VTAPDPLECLALRTVLDERLCTALESEHCETCQLCPGHCACRQPIAAPRPIYADPDFGHEWDENGENKTNVYAGWDFAFGCRVNFTLDDDGTPHASVSLSDHERRNGGCTRTVTSQQIRAFAHHLIQMTEEMRELTTKENDRG
jgi:hypothetical protein